MAQFSSGARFQIFAIRSRNQNHKKGRDRKNKQESEKKTHKRISRFSQIYSARGFLTETKRYATFQLSKQTRSTTTNVVTSAHTCGISTPNPTAAFFRTNFESIGSSWELSTYERMPNESAPKNLCLGQKHTTSIKPCVQKSKVDALQQKKWKKNEKKGGWSESNLRQDRFIDSCMTRTLEQCSYIWPVVFLTQSKTHRRISYSSRVACCTGTTA